VDILDLVFPKRCVNCGRWGEYVCEECQVGMWEEEQICPTCCRNSRYGERHKYCRGELEGLTCLWAYEGIARKLITKAKYSGQFDVLEFLISNFPFDSAQGEQFFYFKKFLETNPIIVPVPLHPKREKERGFNQATIVASLIANRYSLVVKNLLTRVKDTGRQVGKKREERLKAMSGAFELSRDTPYVIPNTILLVDDVWTTGATLRECAKVLRRGGAKQVWGLVLAR